ncbi:hypothetical protein BGZ97_007960, partial [Linnemannia gamsii]
MQQKFFIKPFAELGDRETVPNDIQITGDVSYEQGYGYDYQRDQATDPLAKPIERTKLNAILHDITGVLQQYQTIGTPVWATKADSDSHQVPYTQCARVLYRAKETDRWAVYESLVDNNTAAPSDTDKWRRIVSAIASEEQAIAGTDHNTIMTPLRVAQATFNKQPNLGYTPVQQGTGIGQASNAVKVGWSGQGRLKATVDDTDQGNFVFDQHLASYASIDYVDKHYLKPEDADSRYFRREELIFPVLKTGYQALPSGLILQWGFVEKLPRSAVKVTYPIAFPHAVFSVYATNSGRTGGGINAINVMVKGTQDFQLYRDHH